MYSIILCIHGLEVNGTDFKLKDQEGNIISPNINEEYKTVVRLINKEYEVLEPFEIDADPGIKNLLEQSDQADDNGQNFDETGY